MKSKSSTIFALNFKDLSKKYQLILTITILLLFISLGFSMLLPKYAEDLLLNEFKASQDAIVGLTVENLWVPLSYSKDNIYSVADFETATGATVRLKNFTHLFVYDANETRVYKKIREKINSQIQLFRPRNDNNNYIEPSLQLYVANQAIEKNGEYLGKVTITFSLKDIYNNISRTRYQILLTCFAILIVGMMFTFFISKLISHPLEILLSTFNQISKGSLSVRAHIPTNEEFGQLAQAFNKMVDSLEESYYDLAETNKYMELKVEQRTQQLRNQIDVRTKAEERLRNTNKMVYSIINTSPLPIVTLAPDFKIKTASPAIKSIFFYEEFEIIDKILPIIHSNEFDYFANCLHSIKSPNQTEKFIVKGRKKNGLLLDLSIASVAEFDEVGNLLDYILVIDDITDRLLAEKALTESEMKYRSLIEDSIIGIGILKEDMFSFANKALLDIWEYPSVAEFLSTSLIEMVKQEDRPFIAELYTLRDSHLEQEVKIPTMEIRIICYDGREKFVEMASNILIMGGTPFTQITFVDITTRKTAEHQMIKMNEELEDRVIDRTSQLNKTLVDLRSEMSQKAKLSKELQFKSEILERTTSVCIVWNKKGECIYLSPWSLAVFGWPTEKLLGMGIWTVPNMKIIEGTLNSVTDIALMIKKEMELPTDYFTVEITTYTREIKYIKLKHSLGQGNTLISAGAEITEQVLGQRELQVMSNRLAKSLEGEKELNDLKTRFISMVSHEFRTPLTVIMSCTAVIQQAVESNRPDIAEQYTDKIIKSVKTMNELMEDVLTIGRAQSREVEEVVLTDFVEFVRQSLEDIQEAYTFNAKAVLEVKNEIHNFYSNESMLKHIVHNLITNALKYTTNGQDVQITIEEKDDNLLFTVADHGIGIPPDDLKRLFSNFFRAKNVGKIAGTGLGLHIVKQSVENLYGTITVDSEVNVGSTFSVVLPIDIRKKVAQRKQEIATIYS